VPFIYVYLLRSTKYPNRHYTGITSDLKARLRKHNHGEVTSTAAHGPWTLETAIAFRSREKAVAFERYLKSGSGRAFATRHF